MDILISDEELVKRVQRGEKEQFTVLFDRYEAKMLRYGRRFLFNYTDIEDAVQEVFIKTYQNIRSFNPKWSFSTWIYRIAHNTFINVIRKKGREPIAFLDFDTFLQFAVPETISRSDIETLAEKQELVSENLATLDPKYREPIILYYFEQKSYQEIADILRIPVATVGVRLKRARELLKNKIIVPQT